MSFTLFVRRIHPLVGKVTYPALWRKQKELHSKQKVLHSVGFEPTQSKLLELESSPLDRSGMNADACRWLR
jgi:hypothetical protein